MAVIEPEVICLDSDSDEGPSSSKVDDDTEEVEQVVVPTIKYGIATPFAESGTNSGINGSRRTRSGDLSQKEMDGFRIKSSSPIVLSDSPPSAAQNPRLRTKHYGNVNHFVETVPLIDVQSKKYSFSKINSILSQASRPRRIPTIDLTIPSNHKNGSTSSKASIFTFDANAPTASTRSRKATNLHFVFKCSFENCGKTVRGDVNFVFHLWAHVAASMERVEVFNEKGVKLGTRKKYLPRLNAPYLECISRCPECLTLFPTPGILLIHYTKCHSKVKQAIAKTTCSICEKDMATPAGLREHLATHSPMDAPYVCKLCNFRSNIRSHVISHYSQNHRHSGLLLCPFCFFHVLVEAPTGTDTLNIEDSNVKREGKRFVEHMWNHAHSAKIHCHLCASSLGRDAASLEEHMAQHRFDCTRGGYTITPSKPKQEEEMRSQVVAESPQCKNCGKTRRSLIRAKHPCADCQLKHFLKKTEAKIGKVPEDAVYQCKTCRLATDDVKLLFDHVSYSGHVFELADQSDDDEEEEDDDVMIIEEGVEGAADPASSDLEEESEEILEAEVKKKAKLAASLKEKNVFIRSTRAATHMENYRNFDVVQDLEEFRAKEAEEDEPMVIKDLYKSISAGYASLPKLPPMREVIVGLSPTSSRQETSEIAVEPIESDEEEEQKTKEKPRITISIMKPIKKEQVEWAIESEEALEETNQGESDEQPSWRSDGDEEEQEGQGGEDHGEEQNYVDFAYEDLNYDVDPTSLFEEEKSLSPQKRPSQSTDGGPPQKQPTLSESTDGVEEEPKEEQDMEEANEELDEGMEKGDEQEETEEEDENRRGMTPTDERMEVDDEDLIALDSS